MQIHFCGTLCHLMSHFSAKRSLWNDFQDERWQFSDKNDSWWYKPPSDGSLDPQRWGGKNEQTREQIVLDTSIMKTAKEGWSVACWKKTVRVLFVNTHFSWLVWEQPANFAPLIGAPVSREALWLLYWGEGVCARCDGHVGVVASIREVSLSAGPCCCLLACLQYIMCDRWVMEKPPPPRSLHNIISDKSASHVLIGVQW